MTRLLSRSFLMLFSCLCLFLGTTSLTMASIAPMSRPRLTRSVTSSLIQSDWPAFGYDVGNTRDNVRETVLNTANVSHLIPAWSAHTGGVIFSSAAVVNGIAYIGSNDGKLYAFNATTGTTVWSASAPAGVGFQSSAPAVANGIVYVGSTNYNLYAFNATTGAQLWSAPTGGIIYSSPTVANGVVYVGSRDYNLYAFHLPA